MKNIQSQKNIPVGWRYRTLGNVAKVITGSTPDTFQGDYYGGDIMFASPGDFNGKFIIKTAKTLTRKGFEQCRKVPSGAILFVCIGSTIGKIGIAGQSLATNQQINAVIGNEAITDFLYYALLVRAKKIKLMAGIQAVPIVSKSLFESVDVLVPPLLEQKRIVSVLETWDRAIEKLTEKIKAKKEIKKGLMQNLLTGKVRLAGFRERWNSFKLNDLGTTYAGIMGKDKNDFGSGKAFITYMNIYSSSEINLDKCGRVKIDDGENQNKVKYGDIFFTTSSETPDEVGISSVLLDKNATDLYLNSFCFGFRLNNFKALLPEFARFYFRGQTFRKQMTRIAQGASRYNLSKKYFLDTTIEIPSDIREQYAIADIFKITDKEIEKLNKKLSILKDQKKYLLNNLITGTIRTKA